MLIILIIDEINNFLSDIRAAPAHLHRGRRRSGSKLFGLRQTRPSGRHHRLLAGVDDSRRQQGRLPPLSGSRPRQRQRRLRTTNVPDRRRRRRRRRRWRRRRRRRRQRHHVRRSVHRTGRPARVRVRLQRIADLRHGPSAVGEVHRRRSDAPHCRPTERIVGDDVRRRVPPSSGEDGPSVRTRRRRDGARPTQAPDAGRWSTGAPRQPAERSLRSGGDGANGSARRRRPGRIGDASRGRGVRSRRTRERRRRRGAQPRGELPARLRLRRLRRRLPRSDVAAVRGACGRRLRQVRYPFAADVQLRRRTSQDFLLPLLDVFLPFLDILPPSSDFLLFFIRLPTMITAIRILLSSIITFIFRRKVLSCIVAYSYRRLVRVCVRPSVRPYASPVDRKKTV